MKIIKSYECDSNMGPTHEELKEAMDIVNKKDCVVALIWHINGQEHKFYVRREMTMEEAEKKLYTALRYFLEGRFNGRGERILEEFQEKMRIAENQRTFVKLYVKKWTMCLSMARSENPQLEGRALKKSATDLFNKTCSSEEYVGYYINQYGDDALINWMDEHKNVAEIERTSKEKEIDRLLKELFQHVE